ncbi:hypothetical protein [Cohnella hongkongensis]|uniref:Uncharacterized protein n=1 Tax=Cohnella hongkongensis TaxID=178337 RepID=A0ABV9FHH0_9BACL
MATNTAPILLRLAFRKYGSSVFPLREQADRLDLDRSPDAVVLQQHHLIEHQAEADQGLLGQHHLVHAVHGLLGRQPSVHDPDVVLEVAVRPERGRHGVLPIRLLLRKQLNLLGSPLLHQLLDRDAKARSGRELHEPVEAVDHLGPLLRALVVEADCRPMLSRISASFVLERFQILDQHAAQDRFGIDRHRSDKRHGR